MKDKHSMPQWLLMGVLFLHPGFTCVAEAEDSPVEAFDKIWRQAKETIYPQSRQLTHFTQHNYLAIRDRAKRAGNIHELSQPINDFLNTLDVSHPRFFTSRDIDYYLFRSMFSTREIDQPRVNHIGVQFFRHPNHHVIREVLDGYPAHVAGLKRGDVIVTADGNPFHPYRSFNPQLTERTVEARRHDKLFDVQIKPVFENPSYSFKQALINSASIIAQDQKKIGYVHLWTGVHEDVLTAFTRIIEEDFRDMDGIILDLRGGYGGAWYRYLDPFFSNRNDYFIYTTLAQNGDTERNFPTAGQNPNAYTGPMVVLVNGGVRSGKEALAYQFKKSNRATLVGTTTMGAFTAGKGIFNDQENYFLYIASAELLLDGNKIEGIGVVPDVIVPYPGTHTFNEDPQLRTAISEMRSMLTAAPD